MMVSRLILGTTISLALVLCPYLVTDTHAKSRKSSHLAVRASRSSERSKPRYASHSYSRHSYSRSYSSRSYSHYRGDDDYEPSYSRSYSSAPSYSYSTPRYYRSGIAETGPLMKITPQRDGRFVLEPLGPQKALSYRKEGL